MTLFRKKKTEYVDPLEQRLDTISGLTRGLGKKEFNALIDAVKAFYEARCKLVNVKTEEEKEMEPIDEADRILTKESEK